MNYFTLGIVLVLTFVVSVLCVYIEIPILRKKQAGQNIREEGPQSHLSKAGTPSMGGIAIIIAVVIGTLVGRFFTMDTVIILLFFVLFGTIGFLDDYLKIIKNNNLGLRAYQKFGLQTVVAVALAFYMAFSPMHGTVVFLPFVNYEVDFGVWYIPFIAFVVLAMVNAVNLTDGLDGLVSGVTAEGALFFAFASVQFGSGAAGAFFAAVVGACLGFLVFNKNPAKIFMGDTGSLALGGGITVAAIVMHLELFLPIVGFVYVAETLSVCIQVIGFKLTKKRVFKMAPLHHHFELCGIKERLVVLIFWLAALVFGVIGLLII